MRRDFILRMAPIMKISICRPKTLWVRSGSILPMGPVQQYVDEKPLDPLTVELYAPGEAGAFTIYDPEHPEIKIQYRLQPGALEIQISPTAGQVELALYGITVKNAEVNGVTYEIKRREKGQLIRFDGRAGSQVLFRL